jgi:hypothetical protein
MAHKNDLPEGKLKRIIARNGPDVNAQESREAEPKVECTTDGGEGECPR